MKYQYYTGVKHSLVGWSLGQVFKIIALVGWLILIVLIADAAINNSNLITRLM